MNNKTHRITAEVPIGVYERLLVYALKEYGSIRKVATVITTAIERYLDAQDMRQKLEGGKCAQKKQSRPRRQPRAAHRTGEDWSPRL